MEKLASGYGLKRSTTRMWALGDARGEMEASRPNTSTDLERQPSSADPRGPARILRERTLHPHPRPLPPESPEGEGVGSVPSPPHPAPCKGAGW